MAKLNRIKVVLIERDLNNKWLADKIEKGPATVPKWVTKQSTGHASLLYILFSIMKNIQ